MDTRNFTQKGAVLSVLNMAQECGLLRLSPIRSYHLENHFLRKSALNAGNAWMFVPQEL